MLRARFLAYDPKQNIAGLIYCEAQHCGGGRVRPALRLRVELLVSLAPREPAAHSAAKRAGAWISFRVSFGHHLSSYSLKRWRSFGATSLAKRVVL